MELERRQVTDGRIRKRKADRDPEGANERLSKVSRTFSLLNLERNARKLEIPSSSTSDPSIQNLPVPSKGQLTREDIMQMDDTPHKIYIYNLDDELSDSDSSVDDHRLTFLPDVDKRLRQSRIPPSVLANEDGELAGRNLNNELVLYNIPSSLSVPQGQDSVRKAIIETRARARERQRREQEKARTAPVGLNNLANGHGQRPPFVRKDASDVGIPLIPRSSMGVADDFDAMDLD